MHLRDAHYNDAAKYGFGIDYVYTHDNPDFKQQFLPDELVGKKYFKNFQKNYGNISPQQMVQNLLNQGKMTQAQFNEYRNMANRITGMNM